MTVRTADGLTVVLHTIEAQRQEVWASATQTIKQVEAQRDDEIERLKRAEEALYGGRARPARSNMPPSSDATPRPAKPKRRAKRKVSPATAASERREGVLRYMSERDGPVAPGQIGKTLRLTPHETRTALTRLCKAGKLLRTGSGKGTRYALAGTAAATSRPPRADTPSPSSGSLESRLLATIRDRSWASLDELVQAVGEPRERVLPACGSLIRAGLVQMEKREGRAVYVCREAA